MTDTDEMTIEKAKLLKVGDVVCDCRYQHLKITSITPYAPNDDGEVWDYDLVLEDGSNCSAIHCCSPADHAWRHPNVH